MKKTIIALTTIIALSQAGCATLYIPAEKVVRQVENLPYNIPEKKEFAVVGGEHIIISNGMNCWHKALALHNYYEASGIESRVVIGKPYPNNGKHSWLEVKGKEEWHMIDPTNKGLADGYEVGYYPERLEREVVRE